jgi:hypothetical protein
MSTIPRFEINGLIDTNQSVMSNINQMCNSAGCWMTFDVNTGLWSVIINRPGNSVKSFNESNIIGSINVTGSGINELYNAVSVEFPHKNLRDQIDYVDLKIPEDQMYPQELENTLNLQLPLINDPVQAQYLGQVELKQSRVDKIIEFATDFSVFGLKAGDIIDITTPMYGYVNKKFRITKIQEADADDGNIALSITAIEYDEDVYNESGLIRTERNKKTGIIPKSMNAALSAADVAAAGATSVQALTIGLNSADQEAINDLRELLTKKANFTPLIHAFFVDMIVANGNNQFNIVDLAQPKVAPHTGTYKVRYQINWGANFSPSPPLGARKLSYILVAVNGQQQTLGDWAGTGDGHVQIYEDHIIEGFFNASKGDNLSFAFEYITDLPGAWSDPYLNFSLPNGAALAFWISAEVFYLG